MIGWRGYSDTETLVEAIAAWGLQETVKQAVGMFALCGMEPEYPHASARS